MAKYTLKPIASYHPAKGKGIIKSKEKMSIQMENDNPVEFIAPFIYEFKKNQNKILRSL